MDCTVIANKWAHVIHVCIEQYANTHAHTLKSKLIMKITIRNRARLQAGQSVSQSLSIHLTVGNSITFLQNKLEKQAYHT